MTPGWLPDYGVVEVWMGMGEQQTLVEVPVEPVSDSAESLEGAGPAPGKVFRDYQPGHGPGHADATVVG